MPQQHEPAQPPLDYARMGTPPWEVHNHYSQSKPPNGSAARVNNILLGCLLAIVGFMGVQLWNMSDRLARVETNVTTLLGRP